MSWAEFFEKTLEKAPLPVKAELHGIQCNVHPNDQGVWVWHLSVIRAASDDFAKEQTEGLSSLFDKHKIGTGEVTTYEGGAIKKLIHVLRHLSEEENKKLPENVLDIVEKMKEIVGKVLSQEKPS